MRRVGIDEPESARAQLSSSAFRRPAPALMIAMALACSPKLLIADEPTTALDVTIRLQILELIERLRAESGMALLLITHDLNLVRRFAERVAVMERGVLVEQGTTAQVIGRPQHPYTQKLVNSRPARDVAAPAAGHGASEDKCRCTIRRGCRASAAGSRAGASPRSIRWTSTSRPARRSA